MPCCWHVPLQCCASLLCALLLLTAGSLHHDFAGASLERLHAACHAHAAAGGAGPLLVDGEQLERAGECIIAYSTAPCLAVCRTVEPLLPQRPGLSNRNLHLFFHHPPCAGVPLEELCLTWELPGYPAYPLHPDHGPEVGRRRSGGGGCMLRLLSWMDPPVWSMPFLPNACYEST